MIGANARAIRLQSKTTLEQVAHQAKRLGLPWTASRVGDLERGGASTRLQSLILFAVALSYAAKRPVTLAELVRTEEDVELGQDTTITGPRLHGFLLGNPVLLDPAQVELIPDVLDAHAYPPPAAASSNQEDAHDGQSWLFAHFDVLEKGPAAEHLSQAELIVRFQDSVQWAGLAEGRAAENLGIDAYSLAAHSVSMWGHSLSIERDHRLSTWASETGKVGTAQKKGQITRQLLAELRESIERTSRAR